MEGKIGTSWINELSKAEAISYCTRFGLPTEGTLDQLRSALREYCKNLPATEASTAPPTLEGNTFDSLLKRLAEATVSVNSRLGPIDWSKLAARKGLSFQGDETESVASFLEACEEFQIFNEATDAVMLRLAPEILKGQALKWFRVNRESFDSFSCLRDRLREAYLPADYDMRLRKDMFVRTQGAGERINAFLTCMSAMNRRLRHPMTERDLTELAYGNLHPDYLGQSLSNTFSSIRELLIFGRAVEEQRSRKEAYKPPPEQSDMVDSEFGFARDSTVSFGAVPVVSSTEKERPLAVKCWNCDSPNHFFRQCGKPLLKFCHRCGKKGRVVNNCDCSGNERTTL